MSATSSPPAWRHVATGESRVATSVVMVAVGVLHFFLPAQLSVFHIPEIVGVVIIVFAIALFFAHPHRLDRRSNRLRMASLVLVGLVVVVNSFSLGELIDRIVTGGSLTPINLLLGGTIVWLTNMAAFGYIYWEWDRGGPADRANAVAEVPDLLFPQMGDDTLARSFSPEFIDYLYVSFTNALAFSPTDTMPLSRWCKVLFAVESLVSFGTVALVAARAINILPT